MKRTLSLILVFVFALTFLFACGKKVLHGTYRYSGDDGYEETLTFEDGLATLSVRISPDGEWYPSVAEYEHSEGNNVIVVRQNTHVYYMYYDSVKDTVRWDDKIYRK